MEKTSVQVPEDIQREVLLDLPLKSLVEFICASKNILSIIRSKHFIREYVLRSMKRPRVLFIDCLLMEPGVLFHSVYQEEKPLLSSGQQQMQDLTIPGKPEHVFSHPIRGLICLREKTKVSICNPGAGKRLTLPEIQASEEADITSFFGYDEDADVFKVLCITNSWFDKPDEAQILTVGSGEESWRRIRCEHYHYPVTSGLCKGGVLYYGALSIKKEKYLFMSFSMKSEEFNAIELPEGVNINPHCSSLVNYNGEIALVDNAGLETDVNGNTVVEMWVMNVTTKKWRRNSIHIPRWKETAENDMFVFKGTIGTGELVFAPNSVIMGHYFSVLYYDTVTQNLRRFKIDGVATRDTLHLVQTFLDHVETPFLI